MSCAEFERYVNEGEDEASLREHAASCDLCHRRLLVLDALRNLPPVAPPAGMDEKIRHAARRIRPVSLLPAFARAAAAFLVLAGAAIALLLSPGREGDYRPRHLSVVDGERSGSMDEEVLIEEVYGPESPILLAGGGGRDATRRR